MEMDELVSGKQDPEQSGPRKDNWIKWASLGLIILGATLLVGWLIVVGRAAWSLRRHLTEVQTLADAPRSLDPAAACDLMRDLRDDVVSLREQAGGVVRLASALGWLPKVGGDLEAAPQLLVVGDGLTEAGALGCEALEPALADFDGDSEGSGTLSLEAVARLLAEEQARLEQALVAVERSQTAWAQVDQSHLSPWLMEKISLLDRALPLLRAGLSTATVAPDLLGMDEPRTYLILALNEDELRAGGGFISGVGEVRLEAGQLITMTFRDSYAVDDFTQPYPDAPEPMCRLMGEENASCLWVFRDSNWSPDFPTAAKQAISLYRPGYEVSVDGVFALDQQAVQGLISAVGPLTLEGAEQSVTGDNVITFIRRAWSPGGEDTSGEWWAQRKSFMGTMASVVWERVQGGHVDWVALATILQRLLEEKHLFIYLEHPEAAAILAEQRWDGALYTEGVSDFLMVVDTNMGYNKVNARIKEEIIYQVDMDQSLPQVRLTLVYTHTGSVDVPCVHKAYYGETYEDMMDRCYWDYIRVYVPRGSQLLDVTRIPISGNSLLSGEDEAGDVEVRMMDEEPLMSFEVMGLIPPATTQTRSFTWTLPADVVEWRNGEGRYTLRVQKQLGTTAHPLTVRVRLPEESILLDTTPTPTRVEGGWVIYRTALDRDREFVLCFRRHP